MGLFSKSVTYNGTQIQNLLSVDSYGDINRLISKALKPVALQNSPKDYINVRNSYRKNFRTKFKAKEFKKHGIGLDTTALYAELSNEKTKEVLVNDYLLDVKEVNNVRVGFPDADDMIVMQYGSVSDIDIGGVLYDAHNGVIENYTLAEPITGTELSVQTTNIRFQPSVSGAFNGEITQTPVTIDVQNTYIRVNYSLIERREATVDKYMLANYVVTDSVVTIDTEDYTVGTITTLESTNEWSAEMVSATVANIFIVVPMDRTDYTWEPTTKILAYSTGGDLYSSAKLVVPAEIANNNGYLDLLYSGYYEVENVIPRDNPDYVEALAQDGAIEKYRGLVSSGIPAEGLTIYFKSDSDFVSDVLLRTLFPNRLSLSTYTQQTLTVDYTDSAGNLYVELIRFDETTELSRFSELVNVEMTPVIPLKINKQFELSDPSDPKKILDKTAYKILYGGTNNDVPTTDNWIDSDPNSIKLNRMIDSHINYLSALEYTEITDIIDQNVTDLIYTIDVGTKYSEVLKRNTISFSKYVLDMLEDMNTDGPSLMNSLESSDIANAYVWYGIQPFDASTAISGGETTWNGEDNIATLTGGLINDPLNVIPKVLYNMFYRSSYGVNTVKDVVLDMKNLQLKYHYNLSSELVYEEPQFGSGTYRARVVKEFAEGIVGGTSLDAYYGETQLLEVHVLEMFKKVSGGWIRISIGGLYCEQIIDGFSSTFGLDTSGSKSANYRSIVVGSSSVALPSYRQKISVSAVTLLPVLDKFRLIIPQSVMNELSFKEWEFIHGSSLGLAIHTRVTISLKWYQQGWFKLLGVVIKVVLLYFQQYQLVMMMIAAEAVGYILTMIGVTNPIIRMIVTIVVVLLTQNYTDMSGAVQISNTTVASQAVPSTQASVTSSMNSTLTTNFSALNSGAISTTIPAGLSGSAAASGVASSSSAAFASSSANSAAATLGISVDTLMTYASYGLKGYNAYSEYAVSKELAKIQSDIDKFSKTLKDKNESISDTIEEFESKKEDLAVMMDYIRSGGAGFRNDETNLDSNMLLGELRPEEFHYLMSFEFGLAMYSDGMFNGEYIRNAQTSLPSLTNSVSYELENKKFELDE